MRRKVPLLPHCGMLATCCRLVTMLQACHSVAPLPHVTSRTLNDALRNLNDFGGIGGIHTSACASGLRNGQSWRKKHRAAVSGKPQIFGRRFKPGRIVAEQSEPGIAITAQPAPERAGSVAVIHHHGTDRSADATGVRPHAPRCKLPFQNSAQPHVQPHVGRVFGAAGNLAGACFAHGAKYSTFVNPCQALRPTHTTACQRG
jgi:hypothetical protein